MKIAILGGSGFLGKYVVEEILKNGHTPIILTRREIKNECESRITDYSKEDLVIKLKEIDAVVHLAAKRGSQGLISEFHDNEVLTQNLYEACYEIDIKNIVYASTISVYSDEKYLPWTEENVPQPKLMYGVSKLACEHIGNIYSHKKGLYVKNLRFAHLFGFNEKNNYMINLFLRRAFNKLQLTIDTQSVAKREFLYAKDAARAICCALDKENIYGTFNIGSEESLTNYEVAQMINEVFNNTENLYVKNPDKKEVIRPSYMSSNKAKNKIGYKAQYTFIEALEEIYTLMEGLDDVPLLY